LNVLARLALKPLGPTAKLLDLEVRQVPLRLEGLDPRRKASTHHAQVSDRLKQQIQACVGVDLAVLGPWNSALRRPVRSDWYSVHSITLPNACTGRV